MTNKEIIKAFEDMLKNFDGEVVEFMAISSAIDLINRLQAENERLKASRDKWKEIATIFDQAIRDKDATIEMLEEMVGEE